jgi:hypothetical protein
VGDSIWKPWSRKPFYSITPHFYPLAPIQVNQIRNEIQKFACQNQPGCAEGAEGPSLGWSEAQPQAFAISRLRRFYYTLAPSSKRTDLTETKSTGFLAQELSTAIRSRHRAAPKVQKD